MLLPARIGRCLTENELAKRRSTGERGGHENRSARCTLAHETEEKKIKADTLHKLSKQAESWMEYMRVELSKQACRWMDE